MTETSERVTENEAGGSSDGLADVPERPKLAENVRLAGEMQDSAYADKQWLIQRDGAFVQVSELLYRVAEQVDGKRSLEEMAAGVSESTGRTVSADNVRVLLGKLIPLGVVPHADGSVEAPSEAPGQQGVSRSPLAINMRVKALNPHLIDPFTAFLQYLFWPPVLVVVVLIGLAAQVWLYFIHGIAGGIRDAVYHPGLLLVVLGIIVIGTVFHEFGHASALRYGGGQVRGMGVGLYLVYPAFYTDVTDNYRLNRWAKLRTDLGGFYFNLIFAVFMVGLYQLTHQAFFLLVILLIDVEILHQLLPFVRFDGYWALADVTGLPDFLSLIGPFIKSVLPFTAADQRLTKLKGWVKTVFAVYILVTIPLLVFVLFVMLKNVPRILATAWDSGSKQAHVFTHGHADALAMLSAGVQLAVLAIPTLGLLYMLYKLGRRIFGALWTWSKPTPLRRVAGTLATVAILGGLAALWLPQIPLAPRGTGGPLYTASTWRPVEPWENGTVRDTVPVVAGVTVPGDVSPPVAPSTGSAGTTTSGTTGGKSPSSKAGSTGGKGKSGSPGGTGRAGSPGGTGANGKPSRRTAAAKAHATATAQAGLTVTAQSTPATPLTPAPTAALTTPQPQTTPVSTVVSAATPPPPPTVQSTPVQ